MTTLPGVKAIPVPCGLDRSICLGMTVVEWGWPVFAAAMFGRCRHVARYCRVAPGLLDRGRLELAAPAERIEPFAME